MKTKEELIMDNKNLIYSIINRLGVNSREKKEDLFQDGVVGMMDAYSKYDESYGVEFTSYAYFFIRGELLKALRTDKSIKVSRTLNDVYSRIEKAREVLLQRYFREPTIAEIAVHLGESAELVSEAINSRIQVRSIDEPIALDSKEVTYHDMLPDREIDMNTLLAIKETISGLPKEERELIIKRYFADKTQAETANSMGMTQVQVSRQEKKILLKMREELTSDYQSAEVEKPKVKVMTTAKSA